MKVEKKQIDNLNIELTIKIAAADYAEAERKRLAEKKKTAEFKGFRKGNVPVSLIQKVYGEQCLVESVNAVLSEQLDKYIKDNSLHILGEPLSSENQKEVEWKSGNDFEFLFDIALSPEVNVEVSKDDTIARYDISIDAKDKEEMKKNLAKYYEEKKETKTDEDIDKEVTERMDANLKQESEWRFSKDIRDYFVAKSKIELPEEFLKRWLFVANNGKVSKEDIAKEFDAFVLDFKWQLVRGFLFKKYDFKVTEKELEEAAGAYVSYQYAMYGMGDVPAEVIKESTAHVLEDEKQMERILEQVEDRKVIAKLQEEITVKAKKITSAKFRELK